MADREMIEYYLGVGDNVNWKEGIIFKFKDEGYGEWKAFNALGSTTMYRRDQYLEQHKKNIRKFNLTDAIDKLDSIGECNKVLFREALIQLVEK